MTGPGRPRTILSVWAHPDDETWLCAGLMAAAVDAGDRVVCVTATRGELGSTDPDRWPPGEQLARVRTDELGTALAILGVTEHHFLDYPDGGCADIDQAEAVARIREIVDDVRPDTVLTFGPDGQTGHADHIAVSRWTQAAVDGSSASLHWSTHTPEWVERFWTPHVAAEAGMGGDPWATPIADLSIHFEVSGEGLDRKLQALLSQTSQVGPMVQLLGLDGLREGIAEEVFRPAR